MRAYLTILSSVLVVSLCASVAFANPTDVSGSRTSGEFGWEYSYVIYYDGSSVTKDIQIEFVFEVTLTDAEKQAYRDTVESGIESIWNNRYYLENSVGARIDVGVDVTYDGPFNQTVTVKPGDGRANMTTWYYTDTASVNAHEFGHMMGLYDEYTGGAVDPDGELIDDDALMGAGALTSNPTMPQRYYQQFEDYMQSQDDGVFYLVRIPAPSSLMLAGFGLAMVRRLRRR